MLCTGQPFVAPIEGLFGTELLKWDFQYLSAHLPKAQKYGVMLDEGSGKILMSHSARNGQRQVDMLAGGDAGGQEPPPEAARGGGGAGDVSISDQARMTFSEFLEAAEQHRGGGGKGKLPYFGLHVLWRFKQADNGFLGQIDDDMAEDIWSINFDRIKEWQEANLLPLVQRLYLFAGLGGTVYHCHYDLQPNLHVQLTGRKRFILFPPDDWPNLYPFPVHHDLDRRSMVNLDSPDSDRFPNWKKARGHLVELCAGEALYIPPYWWHHVQSVTPTTTSMAVWLFEHFPLSSEELYGLSPRADAISLMRDAEELVGKHFPDADGEEDCTKSRPTKSSQVANFMQWLKPRVGGGDGKVDETGLRQLTSPPERVEAALFKMLRESCEALSTDGQVRARLREYLARRF